MGDERSGDGMRAGLLKALREKASGPLVILATEGPGGRLTADDPAHQAELDWTADPANVGLKPLVILRPTGPDPVR